MCAVNVELYIFCARDRVAIGRECAQASHDGRRRSRRLAEAQEAPGEVPVMRLAGVQQAYGAVHPAAPK